MEEEMTTETRDYFKSAVDLLLSAGNTGKLERALTHAELDSLADSALAALNRMNKRQGCNEVSIKQDFLCYDCCQAAMCEFVYDSYNTNNRDCLADK